MEELLEALEASIDRDHLQKLGIPDECLPPITRGFPSLIGSQDKTHPDGYFSNLEALKKRYLDRASLHLYHDAPIPADARVVIFTWVIGDGYGDWAAQLETARILGNLIPKENLSLITMLWEEAKFPIETTPYEHHVFRYSDSSEKWRSIVPEPLSKRARHLLDTASFILQIPTYYPHTAEIIPPHVPYALIGEGGWIDSPHFNPLTDARCQGLHYLESGIFIKEMPSKEEAVSLLSPQLKSLLFSESSPQTHSFNCAYTYPECGLYLYLHTLLKSLEDDSKHIDVALFNLHHILENIDTLYLPLFHKAGIQEVIIDFEGTRTCLPISEAGKRLRLIHLPPLSNKECLALIARTDDLVGCKADGSFSEAVSAGLPFFLDPPPHKKELIHDLIALARHYLPENQALHAYLDLILAFPRKTDTSPLTLPYIQELGNKMGSLLKDPAVPEGMRTLARTIRERYNIAPVIQNITRQALSPQKSLTI